MINRLIFRRPNKCKEYSLEELGRFNSTDLLLSLFFYNYVFILDRNMVKFIINTIFLKEHQEEKPTKVQGRDMLISAEKISSKNDKNKYHFH